jgi:hypothetical protein
MANILLSWLNRADLGTLSGGSWVSSLPLDNLKDRQVQRVARTTDDALASTKFIIDLNTIRGIGVIALAAHNISSAGQVRITGNDTAVFSSPIYDSGWFPAWPDGVVLDALIEWEEDKFWAASFGSDDLAGYRAPVVHVPADPQYLQHWQVEIDDATNSDTYIQIGRLFMGPTWVAEVNYSYGAELVYEDPTPVETSLSGAEYFDERPRARVFRFTLAGMSDAEAYSGAMEMQRVAGISGDVLVVPDIDDETYGPMRNFIGRMRRLGPVTHSNIARHTTTFELKENI